MGALRHGWRTADWTPHDETRHFSTPKPPKPAAAVTPITDTTAADEAAAQAKEQARRKRGRGATILTSPVGAGLGASATGDNPANPGVTLGS